MSAELGRGGADRTFVNGTGTWEWDGLDEAVTFHHQPIVAWPSRSVIGHEALTRFTDSRFPNPFVAFEMAKVAGEHRKLDRFLLERICARSDPSRSGVVFANLLPSSLTSGVITTDDIVSWVQAAGFAPGRFVIEIVEHDVVEDIAWITMVADRLREHGIGVAVDDCGDVDGTFELAAAIKPTYLKIDRGVVVAECEESTGLLEEIARFAASMGSVTIAEGIEQEHQAWAVHDAGVVLLQGFGLGRPAPDYCEVIETTGAEGHSAYIEVAASILDSQAAVATGAARTGGWMDDACRRRMG